MVVSTTTSNPTQGVHPGNDADSMLLDTARQQALIKQHAAVLSATGGVGGGDIGRLAPPVEQRSDINYVDVTRRAEQQQQQREPPPPSTTGKPPLNKALLMAQYYAMASKLARQQQQPQPPQQPPKQTPPRPQRVITPGMIARRPIEMKHNIIMRSGGHKKSTDSVSESVNTDATEHIYNTKLANSRRKKETAFQPTLERLDTFEPVESVESTSRDDNLTTPKELKKSQSTKSDVSKNSLKTEAEIVLQNSPRNDRTKLLTIDNEHLSSAGHPKAVSNANQKDSKKQVGPSNVPSEVSDSGMTKIAVNLGTQLEQINSKMENLQKELILLARPDTISDKTKHVPSQESKCEDSIQSQEVSKGDSKSSGQSENSNMDSGKKKSIRIPKLSTKYSKRLDLDGASKDGDESGLSLTMNSTLSHAEFLSVQSSITTDKAAFKQKPGVLRRTASLVRNPALALRRSKADKEREELTKRIKHAQTVARLDNRKKEVFDDCSNDIVESEDSPDQCFTGDILIRNRMHDTDVVQYHSTNGYGMPHYDDLVLGADSMYEDTDIILDTTGTFDHPSTRNQRVMAQHQATQAHESPYYEIVTSVPSKEIAIQTSPLRSNTPTASEVGTFNNVMESLGLCGARFCMGTSKAMLSCADSCSDNPNGKKVVVSQQLSAFDNEMMARLSPRNGVVRSTSHASLPSMLPPYADKIETELEAAGIFTKALSMALQATVGGNNQDQQPTNLNQQLSRPSNLPQQNIIQQMHRTKKQAYADFESIDGRFVNPDHLHKRKPKHVPRDIAVTPKRKHRHGSNDGQHHEGDGSSDRSDDVKKTSKAPKKGFGKFMHKIGLAR